MDRRAFISTLAGGLLTVPLAVEAQQAGKVVPKIGIINFNSPPKRVPAADVFWGPMARLGWVEGQNVTVERRDAAGDWNQVPRLALELSRLNVDVFVITSEAAAQYVQQATRTIPICAFAGDFQAAGLVKNLSKPDQNVTGVQSVQIELTGKRLALLKEAVPGLARVGVLVTEQRYPSTLALLRNAEDAARALGLQVQVAEPPHPGEFDQAFATLIRAQVRGLVVVNNPYTAQHRSQIVELAVKHRIVAIYTGLPWVESGGLMSYGVTDVEIQRRMAECVDKILRGAKPADVPVQQPTQFQLVINLKTAKALGLTIPPSLLQRADQVIE